MILLYFFMIVIPPYNIISISMMTAVSFISILLGERLYIKPDADGGHDRRIFIPGKIFISLYSAASVWFSCLISSLIILNIPFFDDIVGEFGNYKQAPAQWNIFFVIWSIVFAAIICFMIPIFEIKKKKTIKVFLLYFAANIVTLLIIVYGYLFLVIYKYQ